MTAKITESTTRVLEVLAPACESELLKEFANALPDGAKVEINAWEHDGRDQGGFRISATWGSE